MTDPRPTQPLDLAGLEQNIRDNEDVLVIGIGIDFARAVVARITDLEAQMAETVWFPPPEWKGGWEGLVTAYDYDRKYVGCIGRETWGWLLASGITEAQVAALTSENERLVEKVIAGELLDRERLATTRQALTDIELATRAGVALNHIGWVARRALAATGTEQEPA